MNTAQTRMLLVSIKILNQTLRDTDELERRLNEMIEALDKPPGNEKDATQPPSKV